MLGGPCRRKLERLQPHRTCLGTGCAATWRGEERALHLCSPKIRAGRKVPSQQSDTEVVRKWRRQFLGGAWRSCHLCRYIPTASTVGCHWARDAVLPGEGWAEELSGTSGTAPKKGWWGETQTPGSRKKRGKEQTMLH